MLLLYHGANSVCSVKVRIVLAEKGLAWEGRHIDLPKGEHLAEAYLKINPRAVVPVLDHDDDDPDDANDNANANGDGGGNAAPNGTVPAARLALHKTLSHARIAQLQARIDVLRARVRS